MYYILVMELDDRRLFNVFIFEHACKYGMKEVIRSSFKDEVLVLYMCTTEEIHEELLLANNKIQPIYFFIHLLKQFLNSLECSLSESESHKMSWNVKLLNLILDLLSTSYKQYSFMSLRHYFILLSHLKLMDIVHLLVTGASGQHIVQKLNLHFPRWTSGYQKSLESQYSNMPKHLEKIKEGHTKCRRLILRLAASEKQRENYILQKCASDLHKFKTNAIFYLKHVIEQLGKTTRPTVLEKLIDDLDKDTTSSDDPITEMFFEYLQPGMTESQLMGLLNSLESFSQPDIGLASCLDDVFGDTCSEMNSEIGSVPLDEDFVSDLEEEIPHMPNTNRTSDKMIVDTMEVIEDSEGEVNGGTSSLPAIENHLQSVATKPTIVKLFHTYVKYKNDVRYDVYC